MSHTFLQNLACYGLQPWQAELEQILDQRHRALAQDKKSQAYQRLLASLPQLTTSQLDLDRDCPRLGREQELSAEALETLQNALFGLRPWRKGPWRLFDIFIDSEWVSYLKWHRLQTHISPLTGRRVLDIGSSNGYYLLRMAPQQPALLLGLEPYATYYYQFQLLQRIAQLPHLYTLPLKVEQLPCLAGAFDSLFSMGVLYHTRSPLEQLRSWRDLLRRGGELVLETLVIPGQEELSLTPRQRYAKMNNVFFLPTPKALETWLHRCGFEPGPCLDVSRTTPAEQRKTAWIQTESLEDFLDPADPLRTIEGYPAPRRAIFVATRR